MSLSQLLAFATILWCTAAVPTKRVETPNCDAGQADQWLPELWGYEPALDYCSSKYPLAQVTSTITEPHTILVQAATVVQTTTVQRTIPQWTRTHTDRIVGTVTATTTDWVAPVSTW